MLLSSIPQNIVVFQHSPFVGYMDQGYADVQNNSPYLDQLNIRLYLVIVLQKIVLLCTVCHYGMHTALYGSEMIS